MKQKKRNVILISLALILTLTAFIAVEGFNLNGSRTVKPTYADEILTNPGIGVTIGKGTDLNDEANFDALNGALPYEDYPNSSIVYHRWRWVEVEPQEGNYSFDKVDKFINDAKARGQKVAFRLIAMEDGNETPKWLMDKGITGVWFEEDGIQKFMQNFSDPTFMNYSERLIKAFGKRYNGNSSVEFVDIGMVGRFGEWHTSSNGKDVMPMPEFDVKKKYIDWHREAFPNTKLIMLIDDTEGVKYATEQGTGWRADCLGDMREGWNNMKTYPKSIEKANLSEVWRNAPVELEVCGTISEWYAQGWNISYILDYALKNHISSLNAKSNPIPKEVRPLIDDFMKKMGYRLVPISAKHTFMTGRNGSITVDSWWENTGVAPPYDKFTLSYRLRDIKGKVVAEWNSSARTNEWLPGKYNITDTFKLPENISTGIYSLDAAIIQDAGYPNINLPIKGRMSDGWYRLSKVLIY